MTPVSDDRISRNEFETPSYQPGDSASQVRQQEGGQDRGNILSVTMYILCVAFSRLLHV